MLQACFLFTNLLAPSLAGVNHLLESLGILLWAVVALEIVLCHRHIFYVYACKDTKVFGIIEQLSPPFLKKDRRGQSPKTLFDQLL